MLRQCRTAPFGLKPLIVTHSDTNHCMLPNRHFLLSSSFRFSPVASPNSSANCVRIVFTTSVKRLLLLCFTLVLCPLHLLLLLSTGNIAVVIGGRAVGGPVQADFQSRRGCSFVHAFVEQKTQNMNGAGYESSTCVEYNYCRRLRQHVVLELGNS